MIGVILWGVIVLLGGQPSTLWASSFASTIQTLSDLQDRSTGTPGGEAAGRYIRDQFAQLGYQQIDSIRFSLPIRRHYGSRLTLPGRDLTLPIHPLKANAIDPGTIPPQGITGPFIYVGAGDLGEFNGKRIEGAIVLMEINSGSNWLHAANFGAQSLIYLDRAKTPRFFFEEKIEVSPIHFPRFWMPYAQARSVFKDLEKAPNGLIAEEVHLTSTIAWERVIAENIYCVVPGTDPELKKEAIIVEAFYDSRVMVFGQSPGADEACGIATLLDLARMLQRIPPARTFILMATAGHDQTLTGMRELIWSLKTKSKDLKKMRDGLEKILANTQHIITTLEHSPSSDLAWWKTDEALREAVNERIKTEVDQMSQELMRLRLQRDLVQNRVAIQALAHKRFQLRRISWQTDYSTLTSVEREMLSAMVPLALKDQRAIQWDVKRQLDFLASARRFRSKIDDLTLQAIISLHLSSHGEGFGAFERGWLYALKPNINRWSVYRTLDRALKTAVSRHNSSLSGPSLFRDTLRPNRLRSWESYFLDRPPLGGEVSAMAGLLGISLVTVHDGRPLWGTPHDRSEMINWEYAQNQSNQVGQLLVALGAAKKLSSGKLPKKGFAALTGRANFIRLGELFPDQPAPGTMLLVYQGPARYHAMVNTLGGFRIKGLADKKHVYDKAIIEGYRFDPESGEVIWAIDKKQTGKAAYRVKMQRREMETDLVMFGCRQTLLFNLLEPRSFQYMTQIQLIDGRREAPPLRYWWSRIDTRASIISAIFLKSGTRMKLTLSDTVLGRKMVLTNASDDRAAGQGYLVDDWPFLHYTELKVAHDMWALLKPRINHLKEHGIFDEKIRSLLQEGTHALKNAQAAMEDKRYDAYHRAATKSWALASRVYRQVEKTQRDVLFGVLFYIALFVPFAFCLERLLFAYADINKRIIAFSAILVLLIAVIYKVHPAFQLAYSPTVVILAFFIMGLSMIVTLIIFFRFENEMILLQRRAGQMRAEEISRWKAFAAAFFLGVNNLRRRRLRTALTCVTLMILTFTIMSFTSVKSVRRHARVLYDNEATYHGFLMKNMNWKDLPREALGTLSNTFANLGVVAPRVWLETPDRVRTISVPVTYKGRTIEAQGLVGLSEQEVDVTGLNQLLDSGRWLQATDQYAVILPDRLAQILGVTLGQTTDTNVTLWGMPFEVVGVLNAKQFQRRHDLDGEPLTPVTFPSEASIEITEVEMEAMESGEDIQAFQSRYQHTPGDLTLIIPYKTLLALGGNLKGIAVRAKKETSIPTVAQELVDRFRLTVFSGEPAGVFVYNASDTISYSGVPHILIPMIISVFIVLNTMIGSVYERKREIGIYTSVGLAPSHVSFIFIAESLAFAVLSVVLGYLLAQTSASLFSGTSLWSGITVNYSSLAGVAAMLLLILVVLISVIYPSRIAAAIAVPDVNRSWTLPAPRQNVIELTLPFLIIFSELRSAGGYIYDYFTKHQDVSHGVFSTDGISFEFFGLPSEKTEDAIGQSARHPIEMCLMLRSRVWLAPFDFGIVQQVEIIFCPVAEDPKFLEIKVRLVREAGEAMAWGRINKVFINRLRKQLLVWRSLDEDSRDYYKRNLHMHAKHRDLEPIDGGGQYD